MTQELTTDQMVDVFDEPSGFTYIACISHPDNVDKIREVSSIPVWVSYLHPRETSTMIAGDRDGLYHLLQFIEAERNTLGMWSRV